MKKSYEYIYYRPYREMKQIVRRSLTIAKEPFIDFEVCPQASSDLDYVQYEIWDKKHNNCLAVMEVVRFGDQQTDIIFQIEPAGDESLHDWITFLIEHFFEHVNRLRKMLDQQKHQNALETNELTDPLDIAFDQYDNERSKGKKATLQDVADHSGFSLSKVQKASAKRPKKA